MIPDPKLDEEALALLNATTDSRYASFPNDTLRDVWRGIARAARELYKVDTPRYVVRKAANRVAPFWIVHDRMKDRVYPFGFGKSAEGLARKAAAELEIGKPTLYFFDPNSKSYL